VQGAAYDENNFIIVHRDGTVAFTAYESSLPAAVKSILVRLKKSAV
jgi:hypothetical protein